MPLTFGAGWTVRTNTEANKTQANSILTHIFKYFQSVS